MGQFLQACLFQELYTHWIYVAPTDVILEGFQVPKSGLEISDGHVYKVLEIKLCKNLEDLKGYLIHENPGYALCTTHAMMTHLLRDFIVVTKNIPNFKSRRKMLFGDEFHRAADDNKIKEFCKLWVALGGDAVWSTGTIKRDDGRVTLDPDALTVRRTLTEQMEEGFAPSTILSEMVIVDGEGYSDDYNFAIPGSTQSVAKKLADHIQHEEGQVKALTRVQNRGKTEGNNELLIAIMDALCAINRRVFIASPTHEQTPHIRENNNKILTDLRNRAREKGWEIKETGDLAEVRAYEKRVFDDPNSCYEDSCVDDIIGIQEIVEGFDWPICSHVYLLGVPKGMLPVIQILGRCIRLRFRLVDDHWEPLTGYPLKWQDTSKIVFLTSCDASTKDALLAHMLDICAYLASFKQSYLLKTLLGDTFSFPLGSVERETAIEEIREFMVPEDKAVVIHNASLRALAILNEPRKGNLTRVNRISREYSGSDKVKITRDYLKINGIEASKEEVAKVLILSDHRVEKQVLEGVKKAVAEGENPVIASKEVIQRLLLEFEKDVVIYSDLDPGAISTQAERLAISLNYKAIAKWGHRVTSAEPLLTPQGSSDPISLVTNLVRPR